MNTENNPDTSSTLRTLGRGWRRTRWPPLETPSAGCIFQNPEPGRDRVPDGVPWSAGALVDRAGMKGAALGGARVSPTHGNFIVNGDAATASDIKRLIDRCKATVRDRFGVVPGVSFEDGLARLRQFLGREGGDGIRGPA